MASEIKKNVEIKTIEHKDVRVTIKIDYDEGTASLVSYAGLEEGYESKHWVFANRGLEYMNGWLNILEAIKVAVELCKKDLEWDLGEKTKFSDGIVEKMMVGDFCRGLSKKKKNGK